MLTIKIVEMGKIINFLLPKKSQWFDVGMFEAHGEYKLIQMRYVLKNNKKSFRVISMGYVNDYTHRVEIYKKCLSIGKGSDVDVNM